MFLLHLLLLSNRCPRRAAGLHQRQRAIRCSYYKAGALVREDHDWTGTIEALGSIRVREIVNGLRAALDRYSQDKAVKAMADRAEAALKSGRV
jgi:hypothetical protein